MRGAKGFTVLELLVVLVVLGLLVAGAVPTYQGLVSSADWQSHVTRNEAIARRVAAGIRLNPASSYGEILADALDETSSTAAVAGVYAASNIDWTLTHDGAGAGGLPAGDIQSEGRTDVVWGVGSTKLAFVTRHDANSVVRCQVLLVNQFATCWEADITQADGGGADALSVLNDPDGAGPEVPPSDTTTTAPPTTTTTTTTTTAPTTTTTTPATTTTTTTTPPWWYGWWDQNEDCKNGGWVDNYPDGLWKNQGDCVSWYSTGGSNPPNGPNADLYPTP